MSKLDSGVSQVAIDFRPPESVAKAAARGLELRKKYGKGGLTPAQASKQGIGSGVARATTLKNRQNVSPKVIRQMVAFFNRHEKNKSGGPDDAGYISWQLWGGDAGRAWANKVKRQMEPKLDPEDLINERLGSSTTTSEGMLQEGPVAVRLIWKKLSPQLRGKVTLDKLQGLLSSVIDDDMSVRDAAHEVGIPVSRAVELWQEIERTGLV